MNLFELPWLELSMLVPLVGAVWVGRVRDPNAASRWCLAFAGLTLGCTVAVWAGHEFGPASAAPGAMTAGVLGRAALGVDDLSAPLLPIVALLHFLTALATARTKMERFSFAWLLAGESLRLAMFGCRDDGMLVALMVANVVPPYFELTRRRQPTRVYLLHMGLFVALLIGGWVCAKGLAGGGREVGAVLLFAAVLIRCGTVPVHVWVTDLFARCSFGGALLFVAPLTGVYAAVRLVLPVAPDWVLQGLGLVSLVTAVYAAGMAVVQRDARRFFAFLFLSHASLVLVGLELHTTVSLTGALALWVSVTLSLGGLGLTLRALEARLGRLPLTDFRGLYDSSPALAVCFLLTGLGSVGFPGTLGFVGAELLVDGAVGANVAVGVGVVLAAALNGIAVVRAYFLLFTGARHVAGVSLGITPRERFAVLALAALILGGGLVPQPGVSTSHRAAVALLATQESHRPEPGVGNH
jgi:NADH-quinone oxidoreductase subunit M